MQDEQLQATLQSLDQKITEVYVSVEKTRKYFLAVLIISVITVLLPLVGLLFAVPSFLSTYGALGGL